MYNIMIVDDKEVFRRQIKRLPYLRENPGKFKVNYEAKDGKEAIALLEHNPIDVILTDIRMPFIDGIELLKYVSGNNLCQCVILFSEYADFSYAREGILNGAFDYVLKPVNNEKISMALNRAYDHLLALHKKSRLDRNKIEALLKYILANDSGGMVSCTETILTEVAAGSGKVFEQRMNLNVVLDEMRGLLLQEHAYLDRFLVLPELFSISQSSSENEDELRDAFRGQILLISEEIGSFTVTSQKKLIREVCRYVMDNIENDISLKSIADEFFVNKKYLGSIMKKETGKGFVEYVTFIKIARAKILLNDPENKIYEVADILGFSDVNYFSKLFKNITGLSPSDYKRMRSNV